MSRRPVDALIMIRMHDSEAGARPGQGQASAAAPRSRRRGGNATRSLHREFGIKEPGRVGAPTFVVQADLDGWRPARDGSDGRVLRVRLSRTNANANASCVPNSILDSVVLDTQGRRDHSRRSGWLPRPWRARDTGRRGSACRSGSRLGLSSLVRPGVGHRMVDFFSRRPSLSSQPPIGRPVSSRPGYV